MLRRNKARVRELNRQSNAAASSSNLAQQAKQVENYMRSIDPARNENSSDDHLIPSDEIILPGSNNNHSNPSLPFLPPEESFGMEPPIQSPPSLLRKKKKAKLSSASSPSVTSTVSAASSVASSPLPSSGLFYSSNRMRIKTNPIKVIPKPRKKLFPSYATVNNDGFVTPKSLPVARGSNSALQEISNNTCSNSMSSHPRIRTPSKSDGCESTTKKSRASNPANQYNKEMSASDGLFEADPPVMGRESSHLYFDSPMTPESAMKLSMPQIPSTPTKQQPIGSCGTTTAPTVVTDPWILQPTRSTPKRVSLDTGRNSPLTLPNQESASDDIFSVPILNPQPSVGTATAASALMSLMVIPELDTECGTKRAADGSVPVTWSPIQKRQVASNQVCFTTPTLFKMGENIEPLSNRSGNSLYFQQPKDTGPIIGYGAEERNGIVNVPVDKNASKASTPSPSTKNRSVSPALSVNSTFKRIPRRFVDDPTTPVLKSGMRLAAANDSKYLNSLHCFVRSELLEVFVIEDSKTTIAIYPDGSTARQIPRVGIRCVHCGTKPKCERTGTSMSAFFPKSIQDIYRGVCTWQRIHFHSCRHVPSHLKRLYKNLKKNDKSRGKKAHWVRSAQNMGFRNVDEHRNGVVWAGPGGSSAMDEEGGKLQRVSPQPKVTLDLTILNETATVEKNDQRHFWDDDISGVQV